MIMTRYVTMEPSFLDHLKVSETPEWDLGDLTLTQLFERGIEANALNIKMYIGNGRLNDCIL